MKNDLISRSAVRLQIDKVIIGASDFAKDIRDAAYEAIDTTLTVEPPVVHGRWEIHPIYDNIQCTRCKTVFTDSLFPRSFCPNCGAKMDKEETP